ncbi:MAG TPA: hypothetical protein VLV90_11170 [Burkholderiales bacterium]|nr:hypothetical protein [Burkholderiales bacterium]
MTRRRIALLALGLASLVAGVCAGLVRLGLDARVPGEAIAWHGALMVGGFFGVVVSLERAVALGSAWSYGAPLLCGIGGAVLLAGAPEAGAWLMSAGALLFVAASGAVIRRQSSLESWMLAAGAGALLAGDAAVAGGFAIDASMRWWIAFFALTIGAERLELSRYLPKPRWASTLFVAIMALLLGGAALSMRLTGFGLFVLAAWLLVFDIARRTIFSTGLTRYIAACLLAGYGWLLLAGVMLAAGYPYDAALHAFFLGFVFSMVFGHAPIIVPAVLRRALPYTGWFYLPLALLHASLAVRVGAALATAPDWQLYGAIGNAAAIAVFIATAAARAIASHEPAGNAPAASAG